MLKMGALRTGADVAEIAWTAHRIVTGDPRLMADTRSAEMPDPASVDADTWREYWLNWPLSAWAGRLRGASARWFRLDGRRFVPAFEVAADVGETFDAMVEELVDYWLARHLFTKDSSRTCCGPGSAPTPVSPVPCTTSSWYPASRTGGCGQHPPAASRDESAG
jgi:hypothetical protein